MGSMRMETYQPTAAVWHSHYMNMADLIQEGARMAKAWDIARAGACFRGIRPTVQ